MLEKHNQYMRGFAAREPTRSAKANGTRPCVPPTTKSRKILGKENKEWLYD